MLGRKFVVGSFVGMALISVFIDLFSLIPPVAVDPLLCAIYGGVIAGTGLGIVFAAGMSTGGTDVVVRILKMKWQHIPIGTISIAFDAVVAILTGIVTRDLSRTLYTGLVVFLTGKVIDMVVYSFDYSKVAIIISDQYETIANMIFDKLDRGVTYLNGEGAYSRSDKKVILTAVKKHQMADLKRMVSELDANAFVIVQEAHQVLGDGFSHYTKESL